jgi:hypothetical protein
MLLLAVRSLQSAVNGQWPKIAKKPKGKEKIVSRGE